MMLKVEKSDTSCCRGYSLHFDKCKTSFNNILAFNLLNKGRYPK